MHLNKLQVAVASIGATAALGLAAATPVYGEPADADCNTNTGDTGSESWMSHDELGDALAGIESRSGGTVDVEVAGKSNRGRELWAARVGTGPDAVLVTSQIHGNEPTGTPALVSLLRELGADTAWAREIRERVTLVAVPQMNPDGAALDRRGNDRSWSEVVADFPQLAGAEPAWNYYTGRLQGDDYSQRPGFDVNRDYHPHLDYVPQPGDFPGSSAEPGWFIQPEAQTVRDVYVGLQQELGRVDAYIDLHHQAPCYVDENGEDQVTMSLSGKFVADPSSPEGSQWSEFADEYRLAYSKQLTVAAYDALSSYGESPFGNITLYPQDINLPGTGLGTFALNGSGTVLFEVRGQTHSWGAKMRGQLVETVERGLAGVIEGIADGSAGSIDPDRYDDIPETDR